MSILVSVLIGAIAGWLASKLMKSSSNGTFFNIILGIIGGYVGNGIFSFLNLSIEKSWLGSTITSTIGAMLLIFIAQLILKKKKEK
tara:strand:- start:36040 stop:36297 length:258 start_codon:yes stop_codon:yes gene_type:complete